MRPTSNASPATTPLAQLTEQLSRVAPRSFFSAKTTTSARALQLEVDGVGPIALPVTPATVRALRSVGRPARYGLRDKTLLDRRVRDTWEIPARKLRIDPATWNPLLEVQLATLQRELGLGTGRRLRPELHNLLVYERGQFFAEHQDTEKLPGMVGSLVVLLPSPFVGGALEIEHHGERVAHAGSKTRLTWVSFYADCRHQVRPVERGFRMALTYNLVLETDGAASGMLPRAPLKRLSDALRAHFDTPQPPRWSGDVQRPPPDRLVYLLDHEYTRAGLAWHQLKSADAGRADALRAAAEVDCEVFLALADVHEVWSCEEEWEDRRSHRWSRRRYETTEDDETDEETDDATPGDDASSYALGDLIDSDVQLRHWLASDGKQAQPISSRVDASELCFTKPSENFSPFESRHEGYMGNYGNTVEHWYHRAAIVLWPRERTFVIRAKASPGWAFGELKRSLRAGKLAEARAQVARLEPFWLRLATSANPPVATKIAFEVAAALEAPHLATLLLRPLGMRALVPEAMPGFAALISRYGVRWATDLLETWTGADRREEGARIVSKLPALCRTLRGREGGPTLEVARWLLGSQLTAVSSRLERVRIELPRRFARAELADLQAPLIDLLQACLETDSNELRSRLVASLTVDDPRTLCWLAQLMGKARKQIPRRLVEAAGIAELEIALVARLRTELDRPLRQHDDWTIFPPQGCGCALCTELGTFLAAPGQRQKTWPLSAERRAHVHGAIDRAELPVTHVTERKGRPYTLVLSKTLALFDAEAAERRAQEEALLRLERSTQRKPRLARRGRPPRIR